MSITISRVTSRRDLSRFIDLPWAIYDPVTHPQWVPPLKLVVRDAVDDQRNPFYRRASRSLFLAWRGDKVVGRIAAIHNRAHNEFHADRTGFFGFFEAFDDREAADALFAAAADELRSLGQDTMRGPVSPSTNHETGLLVRGFRFAPSIMTPWNPRYYLPLFEGAGLVKAKDLLAYFLPMSDERFALPPQFQAHADRARAKGMFTFRDINLRDFVNEMDRCWQIYNGAWEKNWGFVPMTREEFVHMARELKFLLIPQFAFMAEAQGQPAGFMIVLPDFNPLFKRIGTGRLLPTGVFTLLFGKSKLRSGRIILLGVTPEFRSRSLLQLFADELYRRGKAFGAIGAEASWILEDNDLMIRPLEVMGAKEYRRWRVFEKAL